MPIPGKKNTKSIREAFSEILHEIDPFIRLPMTYARGREMAEHKLLTEEMGVKVYFADPSSPWQIGTTENTNEFIRQYFPRKTDFTKVSFEEIKFAQNQLNGRPRKVLDWKTPNETFKKLVDTTDA